MTGTREQETIMVANPQTGTKAATGIHAPVKPSAELGAIVGSEALPRSEVVSKIWAYIKAEKLQSPDNRREIVADEKLRKIFGKERVSMFEMNKHISQHLTKA
ncbi:SWIB/MDM2 domain-containing protein [Sphingomonas sp. 179-I 2A4 NHS]|uniref:SWIB/MDM2 domain-containing protein n=1 Tax=unclassified Sphingomonas TaxID=196159 RepID=UPI0038792B52